MAIARGEVMLRDRVLSRTASVLTLSKLQAQAVENMLNRDDPRHPQTHWTKNFFISSRLANI